MPAAVAREGPWPRARCRRGPRPGSRRRRRDATTVCRSSSGARDGRTDRGTTPAPMGPCLPPCYLLCPLATGYGSARGGCRRGLGCGDALAHDSEEEIVLLRVEERLEIGLPLRHRQVGEDVDRSLPSPAIDPTAVEAGR